MSEPDSDHELADSLLPWFVNGTLDRDEHKLVERHAAVCEECTGNIALLTRVRNVVGDARPTPMVPQPRPAALAEAFDAREAPRAPRRTGWVAAAGFAAVVLITAIFMLVPQQDPEQPLVFETASSSTPPLPMDYVFSVRFEDGATRADRERVLQELGARQISVTADPSEYRLVVPLPAASLEDLERYTKQLESLPEVQAVKAVALQLPVSRSR